MKIKILCVVLLFVPAFLTAAYAKKEDGQIYSQAIRESRSGNMDAAFMQLRSLLTGYPDSKYAENALFAVGEYYFLIADYDDSSRAFVKYLDDYPESKFISFALMYLLKIAEKRGDGLLAKSLEKKIVTFRRVCFLFKECKEYKYRSVLNKKHRAAYYIDKVEFYIDGALFAKISF